MTVGERILVKPLPPEEHPQGLKLPESVAGPTLEVEVISVGNEVKSGIQKGNRLHIPKKAGADIKLGREDFKVISERDILVVEQVIAI